MVEGIEGFQIGFGKLKPGKIENGILNQTGFPGNGPIRLQRKSHHLIRRNAPSGFRNVAGCAPTIENLLPERLRIRAPGKDASHANHSDGAFAPSIGGYFVR
jgi:hypothetical protein